MSVVALKSFLSDRWVDGSGPATPLLNPATEEVVGEVRSGGADLAAALTHARTVGGPALRSMTFAQRGALLEKLASVISAHREEILALAVANGGNTRGDAKFDVDGAIGTLGAYVEIAKGLGDQRVLADGESIAMGRSARVAGQHWLLPREGVAVHINAFNFPAWGMAEKLAVALAAGMPVITKPATATCLAAFRMMELWVESKVLPAGALGFLAGSAGSLLDHLQGQDVLAFTGSSDTAVGLRAGKAVTAHGVRVNVEADSLNAAVLGPDVEPGSETFGLFIGDVVRDMTQKTGQKCTAIRRIYAPSDRLAAVREALIEKLSAVKVGNPADERVTMGPVATASQLRDVRAGVEKLKTCAKLAFGDPTKVDPLGSPPGKGFFLPVVLLEAGDPKPSDAVHTHEVFGPVATLMAYDGKAARAVELVRAGGGGLVCSAYSDDKAYLRELVMGIGAHHGRVVIGGSKVVGQALPPGMVMPTLVHGGPGRAGGGEELGGRRGLSFYQQRVALQGFKPLVEQIFSES